MSHAVEYLELQGSGGNKLRWQETSGSALRHRPLPAFLAHVIGLLRGARGLKEEN